MFSYRFGPGDSSQQYVSSCASSHEGETDEESYQVNHRLNDLRLTKEISVGLSLWEAVDDTDPKHAAVNNARYISKGSVEMRGWIGPGEICVSRALPRQVSASDCIVLSHAHVTAHWSSGRGSPNILRLNGC